MNFEKAILRITTQRARNILVLLFTLCLVSIAVLAQDSSSLEYLRESSAQKSILDNGMTVITKKIPASRLVSLALIVKTGSTTEGEFLGSGISHFVEHMLFKGTGKRQAGRITKEIESLGGKINGFTTYDYTGYTVTLPKEKINKGLEILADAIINSQFDAQELEKEREVILSEIRLYQDDPDRRIYRLLFSNVYTRHPYRHPIIGYEPLLKALESDDLLKYYERTYIPNNIILAVAGDISRETLLPKIKDEFKEFKIKPYILRNLSPEPEQLAIQRIEDEYPTKLTRMFLGFKGVSIADKDLFALDVLALILGRGESSRLYREIYKNKGLVYSIGAFNFTPMDEGIFGIRCTLEKEKTDAAIETIYLEIDKIKKGEINNQELDKAKRQVISSYIFSRQTTGKAAMDLAISEVLTNDFNFSGKYVEAVNTLTKEALRKAAEKYLNKETLTIAILNPISPEQEIKKETEKKKSKIKRIILDNGLTVLLKEDKSYPTVSIKAIFGGGLRAETEDTNGISNLASRMLLRGTESRSSEAIAETIESLGGEINAFSGSNSFGLSLDILSQDLEIGVEILADAISNSIFPRNELEKEKELTLSRIRAQDDSIFKIAFKSLKKALFKTHPYRFDPLGGQVSVKRISRRNVVKFYKDSLIPGNMILSVFGDVKPEFVLELIKSKFGKLAPGEIINVSLAQSSPQKLKEITISTPKKQAVIMLGFPGIKFTDLERYPLEVLDSILTSSGGRLYQKIREELGQAYTLGGGSVAGVEPGFYYLYVSTTIENLAKIREIILKEIKNLQTNYVNDKELSEIKVYLEGVQKMALETNSALALNSSLDELYGLGFNNYKLYQEKINKVSKEDIMRAAKLYLNTNSMAVVIVKPMEVEKL